MRALAFLAPLLLLSGCALLPAPIPDAAYYPNPVEPTTTTMSQTLWRAAHAAGDDPSPYAFARLQSDTVAALAADDAIFYLSDGLARLPPPQRDALVAQAVAHHVLSHDCQRRALSLGVSAGFAALGFIVPGLGLLDFVVNPLVIRAFGREQHLAADRKAVEILRSMGHPAPGHLLASALRAAARINGPAATGPLATEASTTASPPSTPSTSLPNSPSSSPPADAKPPASSVRRTLLPPRTPRSLSLAETAP